VETKPLTLPAGGEYGLDFLEWTGENHLRHSKFIALREDKKARDANREQ
jgi:hypothetical protein